MNINSKKLAIATLITNSLIIIGAGHGIAPLGLFEAVLFLAYEKEYMTFSLAADYDHSLYAAEIISFAGQLIILLCIIFKRFDLSAVGLLISFLGFYYLVHNYKRDLAAQLSFFTGLPFIMLSIFQLLNLTKNIFFNAPSK